MNAFKRTNFLLAAALLSSLFAFYGPTASHAAESTKVAKSFYTVDHYGPSRDAMADLQETMRRAQADKKRIILQVGGDWCGWCHVLTRTFENNSEIRTALQENFLVMKVNVDQTNPNRAFLSNFPPINAFPHLFVLEGDGILLRSQDPTQFEASRGYSAKAVLAFLNEMAPKAE